MKGSIQISLAVVLATAGFAQAAPHGMVPTKQQKVLDHYLAAFRSPVDQIDQIDQIEMTSKLKAPTVGAHEYLRMQARGRIYLDNFDHITAYWVGLGTKLAQVALNYGADDIHGTIIEEHIFHMAGAKSPQAQKEADMVKAIREVGRTPVQRNTFYEPIKVWDDAGASADAVSTGGNKVLENNLATA